MSEPGRVMTTAANPAVLVTVDGEHRERDVVWPTGWPLPAVGDTVRLPGQGADIVLHVRSRSWYPDGDGMMSPPYVYLVLGDRRPS